MANSLPFNAVAVDGEYDRVYKAEDWAWYFATFIANGIFPKPSDGLQVVAYSGMEIRVNAGYAFINGYAFRNPATLSVTLDTAEGALNRVDRVVVRWDLPQRDMYIAVLKGTPSAKPTATAVTRTTEIWELALADIYVGKGVTRIQTQNITDQRFNSAVCGIVTGTVEEIDASVLTKQFTDFFNTYSAAVLDEFSAYKQNMEKYLKDGRHITLLEAMGDYGNVQKAYNKARKCKRHRKDVLIFTKDKEENLDKVREDIINLAYEPSKYHYFKVYEPKERQIMALPFYDRVVQHAINNVLEPIFDKRFISQSYACRKGKGMHAASDTLKEWLYEWNKYHPDQPLYAIKADIHHYFQSIDHAVLKTEIRKVIKDAGVLALLDRIIDHNGNMPDGVGIPVGNLTSQLFANIYLDALDQFIKHELGVEAYIRYMDDFVILSPDKEQLRSWLAQIEQFLREELKLEFNPKTTILAAKNGIDFVGYKHRATHRKVRKDSIKRIKRTIKKCESGKITKEQLQKSIQSWTGHAGHADSYNLRKKIETLAEAAIEKAA